MEGRAKKSMEDYFIWYDHQIKDRGKTSIWDSVLSVDIYKVRSSPINCSSRTENIKYLESLCTIESSSTQFFLSSKFTFTTQTSPCYSFKRHRGYIKNILYRSSPSNPTQHPPISVYHGDHEPISQQLCLILWIESYEV